MLRLKPERRQKLVEMYRNMRYAVEGGAWWSCEKIDNAVIKWALQNGRWPRNSDYFRDNHLPCRSVRDWHDHGHAHGCRSWWLTNEQCYRGWGPVSWSRLSKEKTGYDQADVHDGNTMWVRIGHRAKELTPNLVLAIPNQTVRRDAIIAYGGVRAIVQAGGGWMISEDDYGKLWRLNYVEQNVTDLFSQYVEVVNSTANPDGTFDHYFLRVPPEMRTAKEAVAWTGHFEPRWWDSHEAETVFEMREITRPVDAPIPYFDGFVTQS